MHKMTIETWPIERLIPYADNPRKNDHAVERMAAAIKEFGFRLPVLACASGELVDGHLRLKAALSLGLTHVPVALADDMSPEQIRAFRLLVNRSATWAAWDDDLLASEIAALVAESYDITLTGFDQHELDKLIREAAATEKDPNALPQVPAAPVVREGELWLLGRHRLLCGDSCSSLDVGRLMAGKPAAMVWADPPYNVDYEGKAGKIKNDKMSPEEFESFLLSAMQRMHEVLVPGGAAYVCHSEAGDGMAFRRIFRQAGFRFASCLIWAKGQAVLSRADYHWQHEPILYGWKLGGGAQVVRQPQAENPAGRQAPGGRATRGRLLDPAAGRRSASPDRREYPYRGTARHRPARSQTAQERGPSHLQAGGAHRARRVQFLPHRRHRVRTLQRLGLHSHRLRAPGPRLPCHGT